MYKRKYLLMKKKYLKLKELIGSGTKNPCELFKEHMNDPSFYTNKSAEQATKTTKLANSCKKYKKQIKEIKKEEQLLKLRQRATNLGVVDTTNNCQLCQEEKNKPYNKNIPIGKHNLDKALIYCNNCRLEKIKEAEFYLRAKKLNLNSVTQLDLEEKVTAAEKAAADYIKLKDKIES